MDFFDLRVCNLETKLAGLGFEGKEIMEIKKDSSYYDKYLLVTEGASRGFIKVWRQQVNDPYMALQVDQCDLVTSRQSSISILAFLAVLDSIFEIPQVLRCKQEEFDQFRDRGFRQIADKKLSTKRTGAAYSSSILINVQKALSNEPYPVSPKIRTTREKDLQSIIGIFRKEYALRYRAVPIMYKSGGECNIVYEDKQIEGLVFAESEEYSVHVHQLIVRKEEKGKGIDRALVAAISEIARRQQKSLLTGTIRGNLLGYYNRLGINMDPAQPITMYIIRKELPDNKL